MAPRALRAARSCLFTAGWLCLGETRPENPLFSPRAAAASTLLLAGHVPARPSRAHEAREQRLGMSAAQTIPGRRKSCRSCPRRECTRWPFASLLQAASSHRELSSRDVSCRCLPPVVSSARFEARLTCWTCARIVVVVVVRASGLLHFCVVVWH